MQKYDELVNHFIKTTELGDYDEKKHSICLYDIKNDSNIIKDIKKRIEKITKKYKFIILNPKGDWTNINILDIEL